jgi:signal transduction histidine kinase
MLKGARDQDRGRDNDRDRLDPSEPSRQRNSSAFAAYFVLGALFFFLLTFLLPPLTIFFRHHYALHTILSPAMAASAVLVCMALTLKMQRQLHASRAEIKRLQSTRMPRAEHPTVLAEIAGGLAHEICNPLAGIAGVMEIVARDLPINSPARLVVKDARQQIVRINRILTDLVNTARPQPPKALKSDLNTTVEHAVMLGRQQALGKPVEIALHKDPLLPEVEHDSGQIHQVVLNLLQHRMQAADLTGKVIVTLRAQDAAAVVEVSDNGPGISSEDLPHIFRPFYASQGESALGLSMARRIVEQHHGRIDVSSVLGAGTTFSVILPLQCDHKSRSV